MRRQVVYAVGRNSLPMFVNSTITSTTIMQTIAIAIIVSSKRLECVWSGGNSIWRLSSSIGGSLGSVGLDGAGAAAELESMGVEPAVLEVHPVHEHRDHHDDAEHGDHVVRGGGAGALLAVRAARPERH